MIADIGLKFQVKKDLKIINKGLLLPSNWTEKRSQFREYEIMGLCEEHMSEAYIDQISEIIQKSIVERFYNKYNVVTLSAEDITIKFKVEHLI